MLAGGEATSNPVKTFRQLLKLYISDVFIYVIMIRYVESCFLIALFPRYIIIKEIITITCDIFLVIFICKGKITDENFTGLGFLMDFSTPCEKGIRIS
jgi:hypothetical protein